MLAGFPVEIDAALHANPLAIRHTDQVYRQIQQEIIPDRLSKVNVAILRHDFFVKLFLRSAFENVKLFEFGGELRAERIEAAITMAVDLSFKSGLQEQPFPRARKSIASAQVKQLQVGFDENFRVFNLKITRKPNGFVEEVSNISTEGMMVFFHNKLQFTNLTKIITSQVLISYKL